jgi:hypothetical protein
MNKDDSNAEWNIKRVLACVCAGTESFLDLFGLMKPLLNLMVLARLYTPGHQKSRHNRRTSNKQLAYQGVSLWCVLSSRGMTRPVLFEAMVIGAACLSVLLD